LSYGGPKSQSLGDKEFLWFIFYGDWVLWFVYEHKKLSCRRETA